MDDKTLIIVDDSDIVKSRAKKMEGLKKVRDDSTGSYTNLGYDLLNIIACKPECEDQGYQILPLSSDLISQSSETDIMSQILEDRLTEITIRTGNRGVYLFDRYYDSREMIGYLKRNDNAFIIRSKGNRGIIINESEESFLSVAKQIQLTTKLTGAKTGSIFDCGLKKVKTRLNPHPQNHPETVEVWLVVARYKPNRNGKAGYFYYLCDFPNQDLTELEILSKVLNSYRQRWKLRAAAPANETGLQMGSHTTNVIHRIEEHEPSSASGNVLPLLIKMHCHKAYECLSSNYEVLQPQVETNL